MPMLTPHEKARLYSLAKQGDLPSQAWFDHNVELIAIRGGTQGLDIVAKVAQTTNRALSGLAAVDGVTPVAGDIVLLTGQTDPKENGVYVAATGDWTRLKDGTGADVIKAGLSVFVSQGTANGNRTWTLTSDTTVVGTDNLVFTKVPNLVDLAATTTGNGASLLGIEDAGAKYSAANVEAALAEVKTLADAAAISATLASTANGDGAALIGVEDSAAYFTGATAEAVLAEVGEKLSLAVNGTYFAELSAAAEAGEARVVTGQIRDIYGAPFENNRQVVVETFAPTAAKGEITVTTGVELMNSGVPAGKTSQAVVTTNGSGVFEVSVADDQTENVLIRVTTEAGRVSQLLLTFA